MYDGSEILLKALENEGVRHVFAPQQVTGIRLLGPLRRSGIRIVAATHDQFAAQMAAIYGGVTGKPGVAILPAGPASVVGAVTAKLGEWPMVIITEATGPIAPDMVETGLLVRDAAEIPARIEEGFRTAQVMPAGPVQLEFAQGLASQDAGDYQRPRSISTALPPTFAKPSLPARLDAMWRIDAASEDASFPIRPQRLVAEIDRAMPADSVLCLEYGLCWDWVRTNYQDDAPPRVLLDHVSVSRDLALPTAIVTALAYPARRVVAVCPDVGLLVKSEQLETAIGLGLDLTLLILEEFAFSAMPVSRRDVVGFAQELGATGTLVNAADELRPALDQALASRGVNLVVVPMDYAETLRMMEGT